jgi:hypothetical protein
MAYTNSLAQLVTNGMLDKPVALFTHDTRNTKENTDIALKNQILQNTFWKKIIHFPPLKIA